uniref:Uncharacterized protein n=1 Tax=Rhipicephalus zambeziensis TaxID=60191 RepID=A0A224Y687_9ACAR
MKDVVQLLISTPVVMGRHIFSFFVVPTLHTQQCNASRYLTLPSKNYSHHLSEIGHLSTSTLHIEARVTAAAGFRLYNTKATS